LTVANFAHALTGTQQERDACAAALWRVHTAIVARAN
jgi:hypothetical protein